jgi:hexosaminidase
MDSLFHEYLSGKEPVFRGPRVNIGTDEYSNRDQQVVEQFRAFTDHYLALMQQYGKQPLLWGSLTHARGTTPIRHEGVLMACWSTDYAQPDSMATLGYQLISIPDGLVYIVPAAGYYYDYLNCEYLYQHWTPAVMGNKTFPEQHPQVEGGMFAVWNDHYGNGIATKDIHHRLFPAMQTVATKCWTGQKTTLPYAEYDRMRTLLSEAPGVNELGRLSAGAQTLPAVEPGKALGLGLDDVGFDYAVSFDIDCQPEPQGTILTQSPYATFYLSSRQSGRLAFERDGYINEFNYALPSSGRVNIRIEGTNKETRLFVNGRRRQVLSTQPVYVITEDNRVDHLASDAPFHPTVYSTGRRMFYVPTLFFPLHRAGNFKSTVTNLRVEALK